LTKALTCARCGQEYPWSGYEQLLCRLGTFAAPTRCAACAEQELGLQRPAEPPIQREHHLVIRMPAGGRWNADAATAQWPPHLTADVLTAAAAADLRIVALGDDLTFSAESKDAAWPALLEKRLNEALQTKARVAVVNAGMPKTTSQHALLRLPRDVEPFAPHLILFSLAFGDSLLEMSTHDKGWRPLIAAEAAVQAMEQLCRKLQRSGARLLYWTPNPILPLDMATPDPAEDRTAWADAQESYHNQMLAHALHVCAANHVPVLDLQSRFEVNGHKSARKWMADWYNHNAAGAQNIANWMAEYILHEKLLPLPE
jgi:lysophospholipase L1-like esterase